MRDRSRSPARATVWAGISRRPTSSTILPCLSWPENAESDSALPAIQYARGLFEARAVGVQDIRRQYCVTAHLIIALVFDGFAHGGKGFHAVAGVSPGGPDQIAIPVAARQSHIRRQRLVDIVHDTPQG